MEKIFAGDESEIVAEPAGFGDEPLSGGGAAEESAVGNTSDDFAEQVQLFDGKMLGEPPGGIASAEDPGGRRSGDGVL